MTNLTLACKLRSRFPQVSASRKQCRLGFQKHETLANLAGLKNKEFFTFNYIYFSSSAAVGLREINSFFLGWKGCQKVGSTKEKGWQNLRL